MREKVKVKKKEGMIVRRDERERLVRNMRVKKKEEVIMRYIEVIL